MNESFEKKYKKLDKAYGKAISKSKLDPVEHFVLQLKCLRDYFILTEELTINGEENLKISTIASAIAEYEAYRDCFKAYYNISNGIAEPIDTSKSKEETRQAFEQEQLYHWEYFWELIKMNLEGWLYYA